MILKKLSQNTYKELINVIPLRLVFCLKEITLDSIMFIEKKLKFNKSK